MNDLRYPLVWPAGVPRTPAHRRERPRFATTGKDGWRTEITVEVARKRLYDEIAAHTPARAHTSRTSGVVLSTNVELRLDGHPRSGRGEPADPGVCLYMTLDGVALAFPCDAWTTVAGNIAAIAAHLGATRGINRWKVGTSEQVYRGYAALPPAGGSAQPGGGSVINGQPWPRWASVLGVSPEAPVEVITAAHRARVKAVHPDTGIHADATAFLAVQAAYEEARRVRGF